jgi:hypothetical protein
MKIDKKIISNESYRNLVESSAMAINVRLSETMKDYLGGVISHFTTDGTLGNGSVTGDYIKCLKNEMSFQTLGDKCLVLCGFFGPRIKAQNLTIEAVSRIGMKSYKIYSLENGRSPFYMELELRFREFARIYQTLLNLAIQLKKLREVDPKTNLDLYNWSPTKLH